MLFKHLANFAFYCSVFCGVFGVFSFLVSEQLVAVNPFKVWIVGVLCAMLGFAFAYKLEITAKRVGIFGVLSNILALAVFMSIALFGGVPVQD